MIWLILVLALAAEGADTDPVKLFQLARNLNAQGKYALCLGELAKLHKLVPSYENSLDIQKQCEEGLKLVGCASEPRCALIDLSKSKMVKEAIERANRQEPVKSSLVAIFNSSDFQNVYSMDYVPGIVQWKSYHLDLKSGDLIFRSKKCRSPSALKKVKEFFDNKQQICVYGGSLIAKCREVKPSTDYLCFKGEVEICLGVSPSYLKYSGCGLGVSICDKSANSAALAFHEEMKRPPKDLKCDET